MNLHILYIEDDHSIATLNLELTAKDHPDSSIKHADTFHKAVSLLEELGPFDLIVSDFRFPGIDTLSDTGGVDFYRHATAETPQTPFVILSNSSDVVDSIKNLPEYALCPPTAIFIKSRISLSEIIEKAIRGSLATTQDFKVPTLPARPVLKEKPHTSKLAWGWFLRKDA